MFTLVTGGSGSGKSEFAENRTLAYSSEGLLYIATMFPFDEEAYRKIERHRKMREEKHFTTLECFTGLAHLTKMEGETALLDCMSNYVANEMYQEQGAKEGTVDAVKEGINHLLKNCSNLVVVTNEVFSDGIDYDEETNRYLRYLGEINTWMASKADEVIEVVYSIPVYHKRKCVK
ncbi:MAG TPA: bifunctional adenosylcobinamide kinase/adenosylcobinamide-phosphate guanylyltransferase [Lachnospiraceae bacterium]|nr:bifunctional adenosylcobinamide kinase/adenosylcobinamide-phosphate guanylyltransferase [Lachnospiraceae bacterium]